MTLPFSSNIGQIRNVDGSLDGWILLVKQARRLEAEDGFFRGLVLATYGSNGSPDQILPGQGLG